MEDRQDYWTSIYRVACESGAGFERQLQDLLKIGCGRFGMDIGVVTQVEGDTFKVLASHEPDSEVFSPGGEFGTNDTACSIVVGRHGPVRIDRSEQEKASFKNVPVPFEHYLGTAIRIDGQTFGTLCFFRQQAHPLPTDQIPDEEINILMLIAAAVIERKQHLDIEEETRQLASIVENSDDAIYGETFDRVITSWNRSAQELYGYSSEQVVGQCASMLYPPGGDDLIQGLLAKAERGERTSSFETVTLRHDGTQLHVSLNMSPIRDAKGRTVGASVVARDINKQKQAEQTLASSEERYALAANGSNDGLWDWDLLTNKIYFSPRWKSMLGFEEHEIEGNSEAWIQLIASSDQSQFQADLAFHLAGQATQFRNEHRMTTKSGDLHWFLCRGVAIRNERGEAIRMAGSSSDITKQKETEKALLEQAQHDKLTRLPNRSLFTELLGKAIARSKRIKEYKYAVLFLDFDRFKNINDSLGHEYGDMLLINIAQQLRVQLRAVDTAARLGGDEFVVLLDGVDGIEGSIEVANRLLEIFSMPHNLGGHEVTSTASIGIVTSDGTYSRPDEVIRDADTAMYQAKAAGKARYVVFDEQMHQQALHRLNLEKDLRKAIERGEFSLNYQPIISLEDATLQGFEALLRWKHPVLGLVSPDQFIGIAEETGDIVSIGNWVLEQACRQLVKWKSTINGAENLYVNVNVSKRQLTQPDVVPNLSRIFDEVGVGPADVKLEITESVIMDDRHEITPVLESIRALGVQLAMDDFGTGHSSLSCLHRFPINVLKIDREFILNMGDQIEFTAVIQAIVTLAHTLGISVVAEGIETADQVAQLQALECDHAQGYHFAKPMSIDHATDYLVSQYKLKKSA